ncbi:MAG: hypothetical protein QF566_02760, partial [Candidatus Thalassarchaeaceae archaeon]|nr:hypothetical protein [Candidatus Thalassarchaeaceae archaeon]
MNTRIVIILTTALLLVMVAPLSAPSMAAEPPSDGSSVTITEDTTWNQSSNMNGQVIISAGVNLTITGDITVEPGSSMDVQGNLIMNGGSLNAANPPSDLQFWSAYGDSSTLFLPESAGTFTIEIFSASGYNLSNYTAQWNDGPKEDLEGDNHSMVAGFTNLLSGGGTLSFEAIIGEYGELVIDRIEVHRILPIPGVENFYEVTDLDHSGWLLRGDPGFTLVVAEGGSLSAGGATISGAQISINGQVDASNTEFVASGPLTMSGVTSSITMNGGGFNGSSDDHDILADTEATITLTNVSGTGGIVDFWERQLSQQVLQFPGSGITFTLTGIGPQERTIQGLSIADGTFVVPANYQQGPRIIEIGYADGSVWTEHATISNITWFTAWGTFYDSGGTLEHIESPSINFSIIPQISVTSVEITKEAALGKRATVVVTLVNTGNANAGNPSDGIDSVAIECYDGENRADISPTYPAADVMAGSSVEVELRWGHAEEGNAALVCNPLTPSQVAIEGVLGGGTTGSQSMLWSAAAEASPGMSPL